MNRHYVVQAVVVEMMLWTSNRSDDYQTGTLVVEPAPIGAMVMEPALWPSNRRCGHRIGAVVVEPTLWPLNRRCGRQIGAVVVELLLWPLNRRCGLRIGAMVVEPSLWPSNRHCDRQIGAVVVKPSFWSFKSAPWLMKCCWGCELSLRLLNRRFRRPTGVMDAELALWSSNRHCVRRTSAVVVKPVQW